MADYSTSQVGVVALNSAMALDLAPYNVQVNSGALGFTFTSMTEETFNDPDIRKNSENIIPIGRIARPSDIVDVVLFLLSGSSNYITGETIFVDGGFKISK